MGSIEYRILAYAKSEYVASGIDFLVVFKIADVMGSPLRAYVWDSWETLVTDEDEATVEYLRAFLHDTRRHLVLNDDAQDDTLFFAIDDMSIGPLRTSASGTRRLDDLQPLLPSILDSSPDIRILTFDRMASLKECLGRSPNQLQAART